MVNYPSKPDNFGSEKIVPYGVRPYVRPPLHGSPGEILHFKYPRVSAVNRIATLTLEIKNNNNDADSFFRLNFKVYIGEDNREKASAILKSTLARITEKKLAPEINKGDQFRLKNNTKIL